MFDPEDPQGDARDTDSNNDAASVLDGRQSVQEYPPVVEEEIQRLKSWYENWKVHMAERDTVLQEKRQKRLELEKYVRELEGEKLQLECILKDEILGRQQAEAKLDKCIANMEDVLLDEECVADMIQQYEANREMVLKQDQERLKMFERLKSAYDAKKGEFAEVEQKLRDQIEIKENAKRLRTEKEIELEKLLAQRRLEGEAIDQRVSEAKRSHEAKLEKLAEVRKYREDQANQLKEAKEKAAATRVLREAAEVRVEMGMARIAAKKEQVAEKQAHKMDLENRRAQIMQDVKNARQKKAEMDTELARLNMEKEALTTEITIKQEPIVVIKPEPEPNFATGNYRPYSVDSVSSDYLDVASMASTPVPTPEPTRLVIPPYSSSSTTSKKSAEGQGHRGRPSKNNYTNARQARR